MVLQKARLVLCPMPQVKLRRVKDGTACTVIYCRANASQGQSDGYLDPAELHLLA